MKTTRRGAGAAGRVAANGQPSIQRRRQELIDVACSLFAKKGYQATSLQDIADEFGILKGSLFHYIKSKEDLLFEIIDTVFAAGRDRIWAIATEPSSATDRLRRIIVAYVVFIAEHQQAVTVWLNDGDSLSRQNRARISGEEDKDRVILAELIEQAQQEGSVSGSVSPVLAALFLLGSVNWVHRWFKRGELSPDEVGTQLADIFASMVDTRVPTLTASTHRH